MVPDAVNPGSIRRALVVKLRHHGDVLLASPVFRVLANRAPHAEIDALVYDDTRDMLAGHPAIAQVHGIGRTWRHAGLAEQARRESALFSALRERRYQLVVHLTDHWRGAWLSQALRPRWCVAPERDNTFWRWSFTHRYKLPRHTPRHAVEANLDALRRIGLYPEEDEKPLVMVPGAQAEAKVEALLAEAGVATRGFIHVHPTSRWLFKTWTEAQSAELLRALASDGHRIVVTAAPDPRERALVDAIRAALSPAARERLVDLGGQLALPELAALTSHARVFVGVDSAPMHIAAAMQTPTLALFGPSGEFEWGPWMVEQRVVVSHAHPCRPCGLDGCGGGKVSECLTTLPVEHVHAQFRALIAATAARPG